jgi:hypothetical protein
MLGSSALNFVDSTQHTRLFSVKPVYWNTNHILPQGQEIRKHFAETGAQQVRGTHLTIFLRIRIYKLRGSKI